VIWQAVASPAVLLVVGLIPTVSCLSGFVYFGGALAIGGIFVQSVEPHLLTQPNGGILNLVGDDQNPRRSPADDSLLQLAMDRIGTSIGEMVIVADHDGNLRATFWPDREAYLHGELRRQYGGCTLEPARNPHGLTDAIGPLHQCMNRYCNLSAGSFIHEGPPTSVFNAEAMICFVAI